MKVNLTYFKQSGKYYASGDYETEHSDLYDIWIEVEWMTSKIAPGLSGHAKHFHVLIDVPEHPYNPPHLIPIREME
jgi:hypothetical protein